MLRFWLIDFDADPCCFFKTILLCDYCKIFVEVCDFDRFLENRKYVFQQGRRANIYDFESKDVSTKAIEITEYERKYTLVITMVYVLCFSTSVLTNWIMLRENTIMVDITFFYLPLIYIAACLNSIALKMLIYRRSNIRA